jgi:hypothetical protein
MNETQDWTLFGSSEEVIEKMILEGSVFRCCSCRRAVRVGGISISKEASGSIFDHIFCPHHKESRHCSCVGGMCELC